MMKYSESLQDVLSFVTWMRQTQRTPSLGHYREFVQKVAKLTNVDCEEVSNWVYRGFNNVTDDEKSELENLREIERKYNAVVSMVMSDCQPKG